MNRKSTLVRLEKGEDCFFEPSIYIQRFYLDAIFEDAKEEGVIQQITEGFQELSDRDELYQPTAFLLVFIYCNNQKAITKKSMELLLRQFKRFPRMILIFSSLSHQSRTKIGALLSSKEKKQIVADFTLNGSSGKIYEKLTPQVIYLNRYAPPKSKITKPN